MKCWSLSRDRLPLLPCAWLLLSCAGCAWMPAEGERAEFLEPPPMERTLATTARHEGVTTSLSEWPAPQWWHELHSPALDGLMEAALRDNQGLRQAYDRLRAADAVTKIEGARLLPWLDSDAGMKQSRYPQHGVVASYNPELAGAEKTLAVINPVAFRYEFDFWGKNRAALEAALGDAAAQDAEFADVQLVMTAAIARVYVRGVSLAQQLGLAQEMVSVRRELVAQEESLFRSGLVIEDSIKLATIDLEQARKLEAGTRALLILQQDLLARLIGQGPDSTQRVFAGTKVAMPTRIALPPHLPIELLAHRPDLAATVHRAEATAQRIHMAKAEFLPSVDLTAVGGLEASVFTKNASTLLGLLFRGGALNYSVMPGIHLPLFEGGRLRGQLEARRAEYDEAVDLYNETLLDAVRQVADSLSTWKETRTMVEAQQRLLEASRRELTLARVRSRNGLNDIREILAIRHSVLNQQFVLRALEADHITAMVDLIQAVGGGYSTGIEAATPSIAAEASMGGLEKLTPAAALEALAPNFSPPLPERAVQ